MSSRMDMVWVPLSSDGTTKDCTLKFMLLEMYWFLCACFKILFIHVHFYWFYNFTILFDDLFNDSAALVAEQGEDKITKQKGS